MPSVDRIERLKEEVNRAKRTWLHLKEEKDEVFKALAWLESKLSDPQLMDCCKGNAPAQLEYSLHDLLDCLHRQLPSSGRC